MMLVIFCLSVNLPTFHDLSANGSRSDTVCLKTQFRRVSAIPGMLEQPADCVIAISIIKEHKFIKMHCKSFNNVIKQ